MKCQRVAQLGYEFKISQLLWARLRVSFVTASEKLIDTVNQQRLEELFFGDRTITLPYPNSAEPLKEAVVAQRFLS